MGDFGRTNYFKSCHIINSSELLLICSHIWGKKGGKKGVFLGCFRGKCDYGLPISANE
nr:MAG TPA: hypothetical protein [Caudoviricetes sp.]